MTPLKILLADDHEMFRSGLKSLIDRETMLSVVGEAGDGEEVIERMRGTSCDCVVLDLSMPNMDGMTVLKIIRKRYPRVKALVLTMQKDPNYFRSAMENGASGYLLKDDAYEQLVMAVKAVMAGKRFVSPSLSTFLTGRSFFDDDKATLPPPGKLTRREQQILKLIAQGLPNKNIAVRLHISIRTVETHRLNLAKKLDIKSTAGLVKYAIAQGLA